MRTFFESIVAAFSMYSKIPMPQINWSEKNMRFSFVFFPLVGAVIAAILWFLYFVFRNYLLSPAFFAATAVFTTVFLTGGIHLDGYCDTTDALSSHKDREEKLRILKDPHVGAFAVIYTTAILLLQCGAWYQIFMNAHNIAFILVVFILSRSLAGFAVLSFPRARNTGLASTFAGYSSQRAVKAVFIIYIVLCLLIMLYVQILAGGIIIAVVFLTYAWFHFMVKKQFGGITGDLAGFYIVVCETGVLFTAAVMGGIM
ncbi:MAG: adenosylcobinamide-GDP ribazoletransferase [Peptococcaceae bacterium]|nr:adenosylcobinamide-GDP ribazoletransferase [Peptococcaceae bacterium]